MFFLSYDLLVADLNTLPYIKLHCRFFHGFSDAWDMRRLYGKIYTGVLSLAVELLLMSLKKKMDVQLILCVDIPDTLQFYIT